MSEQFDKLVALMAALRAPDGCPWDRKQTHDSLKPYLLEETYEVLETIDQGHEGKLREELGDVLLQVLFHSQIAAESGTFTIDDVLDHLAAKLIRRHPHVFNKDGGAAQMADGEQVLTQWEEIKRAERQADGAAASALDGVPKALPALLRAYQIQARAARVGFDWSHDAAGFEEILKKIQEEIAELRQAVAAARLDDGTPASARAEIAGEAGDLLFSLVNLARFLKINPEDALRLSINRFVERFHLVEDLASGQGRSLTEMSLAEMDRLWDEAKRRLREQGAAASAPSPAPPKNSPTP
jgi:tetrapyrrole methylase family protein/MazG family protein